MRQRLYSAGVKRDLLQCQKRPTAQAKETYYQRLYALGKEWAGKGQLRGG
jgi:hypothetical protein